MLSIRCHMDSAIYCVHLNKSIVKKILTISPVFVVAKSRLPQTLFIRFDDNPCDNQ